MDIIIFAAVALFIFLKLRSQFGKVDEDQKREAIKKFLKEEADTINKTADEESEAQNLVSSLSENNSESANLNNLEPQIKDDLTEVLAKSKVSVDNFLNGAHKAFEIVIKAFGQGDKETLQKLLSPNLYKKFSENIDERIQNNEVLSTNIVSLDATIVKSAQISSGQAIISVNFLSKQINYVLDSNQEVSEGSKDQINEVSDVWSFARDINSKNPNWTIISTSEQSLTN